MSTLLPVFHLFNAFFTAEKSSRGELLYCQEKMISILVSCFNEGKTIGDSVKGLLAIGYSNFEAIFINDGSDDETFSILAALLELEEAPDLQVEESWCFYRSKKYSNFFVVDKGHEGKGAALNVGILVAKADIIVTLDADSFLDYNALAQMNAAFQDPDVVAAGGAIHISQSHYRSFQQSGVFKRLLISLQALEYLKGFYVYKLSLSKQKAISVISGAFATFRKQELLAVGGYRNTLGEDVDITIRLQQQIQNSSKKILFLPQAHCYTQCPETLEDLKKQRMRWQKGFIDCAFRERGFLFKTVLSRSLSFHFFIEAVFVNLCACLFTVASHILALVFAFKDPGVLYVFLAFQGFSFAFNAVHSFVALHVAAKYIRHPPTLFKKIGPAIFLDALFYRYFTLVIFLGGTVAYFWNRNDNSWHKFARVKQESIALGIGGSPGG